MWLVYALQIDFNTQTIIDWSLMNSTYELMPVSIINSSLSFHQEKVFQRLQELIVLSCLEKDSRSLREWRKSLPDFLKRLSKVKKSQNLEFQQLMIAKDKDSFIFTPEESNKPLQRDAWNRLINGFLTDCSQKLEREPKIRSHSFRIGYITKLWKDTKDIEFVRQFWPCQN